MKVDKIILIPVVKAILLNIKVRFKQLKKHTHFTQLNR